MQLKKPNKSIIVAFSFIAASVLSALWAYSSKAEKKPENLVDFTLPDIDGKQRSLSEFRGKWVLVNYWATWCPPCITEIPELVDFHERHRNKDAVVVGIDFEDIDTKELREFVDSYFMSYTILRMKPVAKSQLGIITGLPTSFLISPQGELVARNTGMMSAKMIEDFIQHPQQDDSADNSDESQQQQKQVVVEPTVVKQEVKQEMIQIEKQQNAVATQTSHQ